MILITFIPIMLFVNNVRSGALHGNVMKSDIRPTRGAYKYNHPPSAEYFAVPVSVVYEEGNRKEKTVNLNVSARPLQSVEGKTKENPIETSVKEKSVDTDSQEQYTVHTDVSSLKPDSQTQTETNVPKENSVSITKINSDLSIETDIIKEHSKDEHLITHKLENQTETKTTLSTESSLNNHKNENSDSSTNTKEVSNIENPNRNNEKKESKLRINEPHEGLIIPVAVVYDVEPEHLRRRHKAVVTVKAQPIVRNRNKNPETNSKINEKENKPLPSENRAYENIRSGIFPKRTQEKDPIVPILKSENYVFSHSGDFHYSYEGGDGTKAFERGELRSDKAGEAVEGSFSYIGKDGKDYSLTYTADENGYRPVGAHLPTPPPIPPAIARALKYLATKPTPESVTESF